jgi:hypothetical protein
MWPGIMRTRIDEQYGPSGTHKPTYVVPVNRTGRYVRIALINQDYLSLAEVKVIEAGDFARSRPTTQSSTASGGESYKAVDTTPNGTLGLWATQTLHQVNPWWQVDLQRSQEIRDVVLYNGAWPVQQAAVWVSNQPIVGDPWTTPQTGDINGATFEMPGNTRITIPIGRTGRYVHVGPRENTIFSLRKVAVTGRGYGTQGAHATQSSTLTGAVADRALDGYIGTTANTAAQNEPFWDADLGSSRFLETVKLWSSPAPFGCCPEPCTSHFFVSISPLS